MSSDHSQSGGQPKSVDTPSEMNDSNGTPTQTLTQTLTPTQIHPLSSTHAAGSPTTAKSTQIPTTSPPPYSEPRSPSLAGEKNSKTHMTVDELINLSGVGRFQYQMLVMCGFNWSVQAIQLYLMTYLEHELRDTFGTTQTTFGVMAGIVFLGTMVGGLVFGVISDKYGRRLGYLVTCVVTGVFASLSAVSPSQEVFIAMRFLVGFGLGGGFVQFNLLSEVCSTKSRSTILLLNQVLWPVGSMAGVAIAWLTVPTMGWRWFVFFSSIPALINIPIFFILPESPRFLIVQGKTEEAEKNIRNIFKTNSVDFPKGVKLVAVEEASKSASALILFKPQFLNTTLLVWVVWVGVTVGYYGIAFATWSSFQDMGDVYFIVMITTCSEIPGDTLPFFFVEKIGRKKTIMLSFAMFGFFCLLLIFLTNNILRIVCYFAARMFISSCFVVTLIYTAEVYPTSIRGVAMGVVCIVSQTAGAVSTFGTVQGDPRTLMIVYCSSAFFAAFCCYFLSTETAGAELKDIEADAKPLHSVDVEK